MHAANKSSFLTSATLYLLAVILLLTSQVAFAAPSDTVLNNGHMRFGDGTQPSVDTGNPLEQPHYFNSGFFQLTYGSSPLQHSIAVGGDGTNEWNLNGTFANEPTMGAQSFDASGITYTSGDIGYGTLVVTGTLTVGAATLDVENIYQLGQNDKFIAVSTTVSNNTGSALSNVRYWVGTEDDFVGLDDIPTKQRGNIDTGSFVQISGSADRSRAIQITSGTEGVILATAHDTANTITSSNILWSGTGGSVVETDPASAVVSLTSDNGYGLYFRLPDLANGESANISWYYGAGATADLADVIDAVSNALSAVDEITATTATLSAESSVGGAGYWMVVPAGSTAPTEAQIVAGVDYGAVTVTSSGSGAIAANTETEYTLTGLSPVTSYDVYFVGFNGISTYSAIASASFETIQGTPTISTAPTAAGITYGQSLSSATLSGGVAQFSGSNVAGSFAFTTSGTEPDAGAESFEVTFTPSDATTYTSATVNVSVTTATKTLTVSGLTGDNKNYDGTTSASASGTASLAGTIETGDTVTLAGTPTFTFADSDVGIGTTINTSGYTLGGADAANYSLTQPVLSASIAAKEITISGLSGSNKVYDGSTAGSASGTASLNGIVGGDVVSISGTPTFTFASSGVGAGITVNASGYSLTGVDADNYSLAQPSLSAAITAKSLSVAGLTGNDKTFDGTNAASVSGTASLSGIVSGDTVTLGGTPSFAFVSANVGTGVAINTTGYSIGGADAGNYSLSQPTLSADISQVTLTISGLSGKSKTYDGTTAATASGTASLNGVLGGDSVTLLGTPTFTFVSANAGTGIGISTSGYTLSGADAAKYSLTQPTLSASITKKELSISGLAADDKEFDGTTEASSNGTAQLVGAISGDQVALSGTPVFSFEDAEVGEQKNVSVSGYTLSGADALNYSLALPSLRADILEASTTSFGFWNGFNQKVNFLLMRNVCDTEARAEIRVNGADGAELSAASLLLSANEQLDWSINSAEGYTPDTYGSVEILASSSDCIQSSIGLLAQDLSVVTEAEYDLLYSEAKEPVTGTCFSIFNTFNPSNAAADAELVTEHWLQLVNLEESASQSFTINRYSNEGDFLTTENVVLAPGARLDRAAGHEDEVLNRYGNVEIIPADTSLKYLAQLVRYGLTRSSTEQIVYSYSLVDDCTPGTSGVQYVSISRGAGAANWLELYNTSFADQNVKIDIYSNNKGLVSTEYYDVRALETTHVNAIKALDINESGIAVVTPTGSGKLIVKSTQYFYNAKGGIADALSTAAHGIVKQFASGTYNTFFGQYNWLRLYNTDETQAVVVYITLYDNSGDSLGTAEVSLSPTSGGDFELNKIFTLPWNAVGQIGIETTQANTIHAETIRVRYGDSGFFSVKGAESFPLQSVEKD